MILIVCTTLRTITRRYARSWATAISVTKTRYEYQTVVDNVSLLTPELLSAVGRLVVESGHQVAKKKPGEPLRGRCDSFVVETDVHYPTDVNLLWDAMRCVLRETGRAAGEHAVKGWRQWRHLSQEVKKLFDKVRSTRRAKRHPERVEAYLARCRALVERAVETARRVTGQERRGKHVSIHRGLHRSCPASDRSG